MRPLFVCLMLATLLWACGNGGSIVKATPDQRDTQGQSDAQAVEMTPEPDGIAVELHQQEDTGLDLVFDLANDLPPTLGCEAGEGCFLDPCSENSDCQSGWCVDHLGDAVCTIACQEECSPGWSCQQVSGGGPDLLFVCVSRWRTSASHAATATTARAWAGPKMSVSTMEKRGASAAEHVSPMKIARGAFRVSRR